MGALQPAFSAFEAAWERGENQVVHQRLAADLDTPVGLMLKLAAARPDSFMLESVTGGEVRGRYSIVGMKPDLIWECRGNRSRINRQARFERDGFEEQPGSPLETLRALIAESRIALPEGLPAAAAGLFGYLGYDMARLVMDLPDSPPDSLDMPDAVLLRPSVVAVLDGVKGDVIVVAPAFQSSGLSARAAYAQAAERVMDAVRDLERGLPDAGHGTGQPLPEVEPVSNFTPEGYRAAVERARAYTRAGEVTQVVPSQRWSQPFPLPPFALYRSLRRTNPSPFMFFFNFGNFQVVGASPEILVRVFGGEVTIRPIAGTRRRGATPEEDRALEAELLADPKERSEHQMLLDLGLEDVARVAVKESVRASETFVVERYSHVMHIVSNVTGRLAPEHDALSALLSGLPAGTVSGAPRLRAMQIIDELEPDKRGLYAGSVGYFSAGGDMDMCIALRTGLVKGGRLYFQAGGGVVADSDLEAEYQETVNKSRALRRAASDAGLFAAPREREG